MIVLKDVKEHLKDNYNESLISRSGWQHYQSISYARRVFKCLTVMTLQFHLSFNLFNFRSSAWSPRQLHSKLPMKVYYLYFTKSEGSLQRFTCQETSQDFSPVVGDAVPSRIMKNASLLIVQAGLCRKDLLACSSTSLRGFDVRAFCWV